MRQINCYIPIKVRITGRPSDAQLEELGETLTRAIAARLSFAEGTLNSGRPSSGKWRVEKAREHFEVSRWVSESYEGTVFDQQGQGRRLLISSDPPSRTSAVAVERQPELPLPGDYHDYAFFFVGGAYGRAAEDYLREFYPKHHRFHGRSFEQMFHILLLDLHRLARLSRRPVRVSEIVIVTHANAAGGMKIPLTKDRRKRTFTPWDLTNLQEEIRRGLYRSFREERLRVIGALDVSTRIVVRGCNFGQSQVALDALAVFFGGQATVIAPKGYQGFEVLPVGGSLLKTPEAAFDFLVKQDYLPSDQIELSDREKRRYIRRVFGRRGLIPAEFFLMTEEDYKRFRRLSPEQRLGPEAEELVRRTYDRGEWKLPARIPSADGFWGFSSSRSDPLDTLSMDDLVSRARFLNHPYRPEHAAMLLRLRDAWYRKSAPIMQIGDPLPGPDPAIFGDENILAGDAARCPGSPPDLFEEGKLVSRDVTPAQRKAAKRYDEVARVLESAAASWKPQLREEDYSSLGRVDSVTDGLRLWNFAVGSARLLAEFNVPLQKIAQQVISDSNWLVTLEGHTSTSGSEKANYGLSLDRAEAVRKFLVEAGVLESKMVAHGHGERNQVAGEWRRDGRLNPGGMAKNRRVEVRLTYRAVSPPPGTETHVDTLPGGSAKPSAPSLQAPATGIVKEFQFPETPKYPLGPIQLSLSGKIAFKGWIYYGTPTTKISFSADAARVEFERKVKSALGDIKFKGTMGPDKPFKVGIEIGSQDLGIEFSRDLDWVKISQGYIFDIALKFNPIQVKWLFGGEWTFEGVVQQAFSLKISMNPEFAGWETLLARASRFGRAGSALIRGAYFAGELGTVTTAGAVATAVSVASVGIAGIGFGLYMVGRALQEGRTKAIGYAFAAGYSDWLAKLTSESPNLHDTSKLRELLTLNWKREVEEQGKIYQDQGAELLDSLTRVTRAGQAAILQDSDNYIKHYGPLAWASFAESQRKLYGNREDARRHAYLELLSRQVEGGRVIGVSFTIIK